MAMARDPSVGSEDRRFDIRRVQKPRQERRSELSLELSRRFDRGVTSPIGHITR
jgi:hypothetical protein